MATYKGIKGVKVESLKADPTASEAEGPVWYNTPADALKYAIQSAGAWASGTATNTGHTAQGGAGTVTAALQANGMNSPTANTLNSETYDGTAWTEGNNALTARKNMGTTGTSIACIMAGGQVPSPDYAYQNLSETYDGTSWTEGGNLITAGRTNMGTVGTTTAALCFSRVVTPAATVSAITEQYDGTSWSEVGNLQTARRGVGSAGNQAGALCIAGNISPGSVNQVESWNGTSWSETSTDVNTAKADVGGKGTTTNAIIFGGEGPPLLTQTETFDGTTWTEVGDMAVPGYSMGSSGANSSAALACGGYEGPTQVTTTLVEEWTDPVYTIKTVTVS